MYTNLNLYVNILCMERLFKRKSYLVLFTLVFAMLFGVLYTRTVAKAETTDSVYLESVLPESKMENYALSSPVDACFFDGSMAVVHTNELVVYTGGEYKTPISLVSPQQVKRLNDDYLVVSQDGSIYCVSLSDLSVTGLTYGSNVSVGCNYFDCNENYIVTAFSNNINLYSHDGLNVSAPTSFVNQIDPSTPISINDKGEIFYVHNDSLYKCTVSDRTETFMSDDKPTAILANDDFVYMISNGKIVRITTDGLTRVEYTLNDLHKDYDLGNLSNPVSLSFKGENLLIADSSKNAVQEFAINGSSLEFTGFAVASKKTAYNRIGDSAKALDVNGDLTAVLDDFKLTVIKTQNGVKSYKNYLQSALSNPSDICLGETLIALYTKNASDLSFVDLEKDQVLPTVSVDGKISDVSYKNGVFYIALISNANVSVLSCDGTSVTTLYAFENAYDAVYAPEKTPIISADTDVIYITNPVKNAIYKVAKENGEYKETLVPVFTADGIEKIEVDFNGDLFCYKKGEIVFTDGTSIYTAPVKIGDSVATNVVDFAMSKTDKSVYFIANGFEGLYATDDLPNFAVSSLSTTEYITKGSSANLLNYKTYAVSTSTILSVNPVVSTDKHVFTASTIEPTLDKEYLEICTISHVESLGAYQKTAKFSVLAGQTAKGLNATFIAKTDCLSETTFVIGANQEKAYIITDVNAYYFPIISIEDTYVLTDNGANIRLAKGTKISPEYRTTFLDKEFFYCNVEIDGNTVYCFVPVNFTVEVLDQNVVTKTYTLEKVKACKVYDQDGNEKIALENGSEVRLYSVKDGKALIEYFEDGIWKHGYVEDSMIIKTPNTAIRNALIIILMTASVVATSIYFIVRKKHN